MIFVLRVGGHVAFHSGTMVFRHNGTIYDFHVRGEGERKDAFDSKRFFRLLIQEIENSCNGVEEAIERIVTTIRNTYRYSSLNFLLSDGAKLHAYGDYSQVKSRDYYGLMYSKKMLRCYYLSKSQYGKRSGQLSPIGV